MQAPLQILFALAKENVEKNPSLQSDDIRILVERYITEIANEAAEVRAEVSKENVVHLTDELGDIFWDYINLLTLLEREGYIDSIEAVFAGAAEKYTERSPAFLKADDALWNTIKITQKARLKEEHQKRYEKS